jgi:hypothetical protein
MQARVFIVSYCLMTNSYTPSPHPGG